MPYSATFDSDSHNPKFRSNPAVDTICSPFISTASLVAKGPQLTATSLKGNTTAFITAYAGLLTASQTGQCKQLRSPGLKTVRTAAELYKLLCLCSSIVPCRFVPAVDERAVLPRQTIDNGLAKSRVTTCCAAHRKAQVGFCSA